MCLRMYEHVLVQLFLSNTLLVREDLLTHISNINTSLRDSDVRKSRTGKGLLLRQKRSCLDTTKDANFHPSTG